MRRQTDVTPANGPTDGTGLWEEFAQIHRRMVGAGTAVAAPLDATGDPADGAALQMPTASFAELALIDVESEMVEPPDDHDERCED